MPSFDVSDASKERFSCISSPPLSVLTQDENNDGSDDLSPVDRKIHPTAAEAQHEKADSNAEIATAREIIDAANDPTDDE